MCWYLEDKWQGCPPWGGMISSKAQTPVRDEFPQEGASKCRCAGQPLGERPGRGHDIPWDWLSELTFEHSTHGYRISEAINFVPQDFSPPLPAVSIAVFFFLFFTIVFVQKFLACKLYPSMLSPSRHHMSHKYLLRANSINEFKYWEYKIFEKHGPCPLKPHRHLSHITEW